MSLEKSMPYVFYRLGKKKTIFSNALVLIKKFSDNHYKADRAATIVKKKLLSWEQHFHKSRSFYNWVNCKYRCTLLTVKATSHSFCRCHSTLFCHDHEILKIIIES